MNPVARLALISSAIAALIGVAVLTSSAVAATPRTNLPDVEDEVMCTICGTLLEESDSPQANSERDLIRKLIAEGETKSEIKDALVAQYGPNVLATPSGHGFDLLAWLVPGVAIAIALGGISLLLWRARGRSRADRAPAGQIDPADLARLDEDMSSYDL